MSPPFGDMVLAWKWDTFQLKIEKSPKSPIVQLYLEKNKDNSCVEMRICGDGKACLRYITCTHVHIYTCPYIHMSTSPHIHISTYPHTIWANAQYKKFFWKSGDFGDFFCYWILALLKAVVTFLVTFLLLNSAQPSDLVTCVVTFLVTFFVTEFWASFRCGELCGDFVCSGIHPSSKSTNRCDFRSSRHHNELRYL